MTIQPGQTYRSCKPADREFRILIVHVNERSARAVDARNGRPLPVRVSLRSLHATATAPDGRTRRTGYVLDTPENR
jgi:hypothetical protein